MGNFVNTNYSKTIDSLVEGAKSRLNNPYYLYGDRKPTVVTYYNINTNATTLDAGTLQPGDQVGENSPYRYNKIEDFHLYGLERVQLDLEITDWGIESPVEGEAVILPNTIVPMVGDMFMIKHVLDRPILFEVTKVTIDTLVTGSNMYKISYLLSRTDRDAIDSLEKRQTLKRYKYKAGNVGTNLAPLITNDTADLVDKLDDTVNTLLEYYINIFYKNSVQTFIFQDYEYFIYDGYLIEFIIRNKLYNLPGNEYVHIEPAVYTDSTFNLEYDHTIFKDIENRNPDMRLNSAYPIPVTDVNSLLIDRLEEYYILSNKIVNKTDHHVINWLDLELQDRIMNNNPYTENEPNLYYRNIIIEYMNKKDFNITTRMIDSLMRINFCYNKILFYEIPIIVYIIQFYCNKLQERNKKIDTVTYRGATQDDGINNDTSFVARN